MKRAKKKHVTRQEDKNWWRNLDGRTREIMMRANSIHNKGIGKRRGRSRRKEK